MTLKRLRACDAATVLRAAMCAFTAAYMIAALLAPDRAELVAGFGRILTGSAQLTKDYFKPELGSVSGAMLNAALVGALCCGMMFLPGAKVNGGTVLGFFLTTGYCTYGINLLNAVPPMLGVLLYSRIKREPFGKYINVAMFSTGLSPLVTQALFYYPNAGAAPQFTALSLPLALGIGALIGCAMPALCGQSPALHKGYNLYNAGPAAGLLGFAIYTVLYKTLGVEVPAAAAVLGDGQRAFVNAFCVACFVVCLLCGILLNGGIKDYAKLALDPGFRSDFTAKYAPGVCLMNVGVYGLFILLYYNLIGATFTGTTMGAVFCMLACCCAGATPLNVLPIMVGYWLASRFGAFPINGQAIVVGLCYASGLAPVSGVYGPIAGALAGALHYCLVTGAPAIHGGFCLYNGGFTAGLVYFLMNPMLERFFPEKKTH